VVYSEEPNFPATDNNPDAIRYQINNNWVDALDGKPTANELNTFFAAAQPST
jgi:hypothetical protein